MGFIQSVHIDAFYHPCISCQMSIFVSLIKSRNPLKVPLSFFVEVGQCLTTNGTFRAGVWNVQLLGSLRPMTQFELVCNTIHEKKATPKYKRIWVLPQIFFVVTAMPVWKKKKAVAFWTNCDQTGVSGARRTKMLKYNDSHCLPWRKHCRWQTQESERQNHRCDRLCNLWLQFDCRQFEF